MVKFSYPLLAGGLLGLLGQPFGGWWLGFLWAPFYYFTLLNFKNHWAIFAFTCVHAFVASFWAWSSLMALSLGQISNLFQIIIGSLLSAVPLFLGIFATHQVINLIKANHNQKAFYQFVSFPLAHYLGVKLFHLFPLGEVPLPGLSAQAFTLGFFGDSYPVIGELGTESLVLSFFSLAMLPFISREDTRKLFFLPFITIAAIFFTNFTGDFSKAKESQLTVAALPWSGKLGETPTRAQVEWDLETRISYLQKTEKIDLFITPETSLPGLASQGQTQERLRETLTSNQGLVFGAIEQHLHESEFLYYNSSFLLQALPNTNVARSQKQFLAPFGEQLPSWAKLLGFDLLVKRDITYSSGLPSKLTLNQFNFYTAICFEEYLDSFYVTKDADADFYLVQSREFDLPLFAKSALKGVGNAKAMQSYRTIIKVSNGHLSEVVAASYKSQAVGKWIPLALSGVYPVSINRKISLYYSWGFVLTPLFLMSLVWLLIGVAYSPYYKKY
ncbi:MAG: hypothetical protein QNL04_07200 [SAR324 cluster bacterium]|nr:hypothetical protein [SAR324 cluster bacterium]